MASALDRAGFDHPVLYVNGRRDRMMRAAEALDDFAVVQFCLRSTQKPHTRDWLDLWRGARCVWSYYDLYALCREDGTPTDFNFYHAPLGIEDAFGPRPVEKEYVVATNGTYLTESVRECILAAEGRPVLHLGERVDRPNVDYRAGVDDDLLAELYSACRYVSGLRRCEGFELPAAEGLACGARPVLFDRAHYRRWYGDWAVYIPEGPRHEVEESLRDVFQAEPSVGAAESAAARERFDWGRIIDGFRKACARPRPGTHTPRPARGQIETALNTADHEGRGIYEVWVNPADTPDLLSGGISTVNGAPATVGLVDRLTYADQLRISVQGQPC